MKYLLIAILTIAKSIQSYFPNPPSIFSIFSTSSLQTKISSPSFPSASHTWQCRISAWPRKQIKNDFHNWMHKNYKKYLAQEELIRFYNFQDNSHIVHGHNKMGKSSFTMKLNKFADLSQLQFKWNYLMPANMSLNPAIIAQLPGTKNGNKRLLQSVNFDWRDKVQFNVVKDQGKCSACYAFADMAALQLNWAIRHKTKAPALSEQQILDCCHEEYLCDGCKSGSLGATFDYLADYGIAYISDYPYTSKPSACNTSAQRYRFLFQESSYFQTSGLQSTLYYLLNVGPLAVAVDPTDWIFYDKGVFDKCKTSDFIYNHAIVLIGTQADGSWIFRNSWGDQWGENGYGKLASGNSCGILNYVFLPLVV